MALLDPLCSTPDNWAHLATHPLVSTSAPHPLAELELSLLHLPSHQPRSLDVLATPAPAPWSHWLVPLPLLGFLFIHLNIFDTIQKTTLNSASPQFQTNSRQRMEECMVMSPPDFEMGGGIHIISYERRPSLSSVSYLISSSFCCCQYMNIHIYKWVNTAQTLQLDPVLSARKNAKIIVFLCSPNMYQWGRK